MSQLIVPQKTYVLVFLCLDWPHDIDHGSGLHRSRPVQYRGGAAIAFSKMLLVVLFFMGVKYSGGLVRVILIAGFFWLALLISLTMSDYRTRSWTPAPQSWSSTAPPTHP